MIDADEDGPGVFGGGRATTGVGTGVEAGHSDRGRRQITQDAPLGLYGVTKVYDQNTNRRFKTALPGPGALLRHPMVAVDDVTMEVAAGERVGLIGANGAGKSTMLKILAGVAEPTAGVARRPARMASMIELGLGFHAELTGAENLRVSGALLGLSSAELDAVLPEVVEFSGIADAMDDALKHYSSGMRARLGFALATHVPADAILVDEVLAVGDQEFQAQCIDRVIELCNNGAALLFVSHEMWLIEAVCDRVLLVDQGRIVDEGTANEVVKRYLVPEPTRFPDASTADVRLESVTLVRDHIRPMDSLDIDLEVVVERPIPRLTIGFELGWVAIAPEFVLASTSLALDDELAQPGRYLVRVRTAPVALDRGHARATIALVDQGARRVLNRVDCEFWLESSNTRHRPLLAAPSQTSLVPTEAPEVQDGDRRVLSRKGSVEASVDHVTKRFRTGTASPWVLAIPGWNREAEGNLAAVDDLSLEVYGGQALGIIGPNGAGKSTLLKMLAGTMRPTFGEVRTAGRVVSMLELGLGFHNDLSGRENMEITGRLLGLTAEELAEREESILAFAGLGDAIEQPLKQYSTGMKARLGLSVAVHAEPALLLVDEVLGVGDQEFRDAATIKVRDLVGNGTAVVFVSHNFPLVSMLCERTVRVERGRLIDDGPTLDVIEYAGGLGWDGGVSQITTELRVHALDLERNQLAAHEDLELQALIEVAEPSPHVRLEFSCQALGENDHPGTLSREDIELRTFALAQIEPSGGQLGVPGWYLARCVIGQMTVLGEFYVVISAIDERDGEIIAQSWQTVQVGNRPRGEPMIFAFDLSAKVELLG